MTKPNSGKSAINKHMNKIQNTKDEPCYSDGRGQFGHSFYEGEDKCMYCGKSRTTTTDKPMNQIDKLKEEFDKEFEPKTIWVVPSKENIETIKDIWSWIIQNFTPKEEVKKIDMKNKPMTAREEFNKKFCFEYQPNKSGKNNVRTLEVENPDEIWNWHISEMEKLLERVEAIIWSFSKYEISGNNGKYIDEELLKKVIQSLNKLKEEYQK